MKNCKRSWRRHHVYRLRRRRSHYHNAADGSPRAIGSCYQTPCLCSCSMCGNQRKHHGVGLQELRARAKYTD